MNILKRILYLNNAAALWLSGVMSWTIWPVGLLILSTIGLALHWTDAVMYILTVQTSIDAAATKVLQSRIRAMDEKRDLARDASEAVTAELIAEIKSQNDAAFERDDAFLELQSVIMGALITQGDLLEHLLTKDESMLPSRDELARKRAQLSKDGEAHIARLNRLLKQVKKQKPK